MLQRQIIERWKQLAVRQITGRTKDDHDARFRALFDA
jgi:hypothetical protein